MSTRQTRDLRDERQQLREELGRLRELLREVRRGVNAGSAAALNAAPEAAHESAVRSAVSAAREAERSAASERLGDAVAEIRAASCRRRLGPDVIVFAQSSHAPVVALTGHFTPCFLQAPS